MFSRKAEYSHESLLEKAVEGISQRKAAVGTLCLSGNGAASHDSVQIMGHPLAKALIKRASEKLLLISKNAYFEIKITFNTSQKGFSLNFPFLPEFSCWHNQGGWGGTGSEWCPPRQ